MRSRRDYVTIISEILESTQSIGGSASAAAAAAAATITRIVRSIPLDHGQVKRYLDDLTANGIISPPAFLCAVA